MIDSYETKNLKSNFITIHHLQQLNQPVSNIEDETSSITEKFGDKSRPAFDSDFWRKNLNSRWDKWQEMDGHGGYGSLLYKKSSSTPLVDKDSDEKKGSGSPTRQEISSFNSVPEKI